MRRDSSHGTEVLGTRFTRQGLHTLSWMTRAVRFLDRAVNVSIIQMKDDFEESSI
jgi:hypothetical protein